MSNTGDFVRLMRTEKPLTFDPENRRPYVIIVDGEIEGFYENFHDAEKASRMYRWDDKYINVLIAEVKMQNEVLYGIP